jgi:hypothetical protein
MSKTTPIDPKSVLRVYSGKPQRCMCGCAGKYSEPEESSRSVAIIVNKINRAVEEGAEVESGLDLSNERYVSVKTDTRLWVAWLTT